MVAWHDFDFEEPQLDGEPDDYELAACNTLEKFFELNRDQVFFGNQLAVKNEDSFFIGLHTGQLAT